MGIALGYAFLLAIAGGMIAICFAWLGEMMQDRPADDPRSGSFRRPFSRRRIGTGGTGGPHHRF